MKRMVGILLSALLVWGCSGELKPGEFQYAYAGDYLLEGTTISLFVGDEFELTVIDTENKTSLKIEGTGSVEFDAEYFPEKREKKFSIRPLSAGENVITINDGNLTDSRELAIYAMELSSIGITDGIIADEYGKFGEQKSHGIPTLSIPVDIGNAPLSAKYFAISMIDPDAGNWVHWLAVDFKSGVFFEDASREMADRMVQGKNSFGQLGYGGPTPPERTHSYLITVYALSEALELEPGFSYAEFLEALQDKVINSAELRGDYRSE